MTLLVATSTMRYVLPRRELRRLDQRPGAYPTVARTGDRTRSGKNVRWFDDRRTVLFLTGTSITYPTTLPTGSFHLSQSVSGSDLSSSIVLLSEHVRGNVNKFAIEQFLSSNTQVETPGPFIDSQLFEQEEVNLTNSQLMTGSAFYIARDRFKSKIANKTAIRITKNLSKVSVLSPTSSSLHYLNPISGGFDLIANENGNMGPNDELLWFGRTNDSSPQYFDPVLFNAMGYAHRHPNGNADLSIGTNQFNTLVEANLGTIVVASQLTEMPFFSLASFERDYKTSAFTSSLLNTNHVANSSQSIKLSSYISHPFLLEKAVIEFPIEAGPNWLNDAFTIVPLGQAMSRSNGSVREVRAVDCGGPMVTVGLLRQDKAGHLDRDLIASATFTTARDMVTASYLVSTSSFINYLHTTITRIGLSGTLNAQLIISGTVTSGSNNFFSGNVRLTLSPAVTHHITRYTTSGSANWFFRDDLSSIDKAPNFTNARVSSFGNISRRPGTMQTGRSHLGNSLALLSVKDVAGKYNPIKQYETDYEGLLAYSNTLPAGRSMSKAKAYFDIVSKTVHSPYLLYPEDDLIVCINKHRPAGTACGFGDPDIKSSRIISSSIASHDIKIPTGTFSLTLYGDLLRTDAEFHDTLNQRLETNEIHEEIGFDPVLDQFDVAYGAELSGTHIDRINVQRAFPAVLNSVTSTLETTRYFSNFDSHVTSESLIWCTQSLWTAQKFGYEIKKRSRNRIFVSQNELLWDCRLPKPNEILNVTAPNAYLMAPAGTVWMASGYAVDNIASAYNIFSSAGDWFMSYPFESKFNAVNSMTKMEKTSKDVFRIHNWFANAPPTTAEVDYNSFQFILGQLSYRTFRTDFQVYPEMNTGVPFTEFIKYFYGIGDGYSNVDNQHVLGRAIARVSVAGLVQTSSQRCCADLRGWKYGLYSGFPTYTAAVFRRDRFGQPRDMFEQRLDTKIYDDVGIDPTGNVNGSVGTRKAPVQVAFVDSAGAVTDPLRTLSSNVSSEATSSFPYCDGIAKNRPAYDRTVLNILNVVGST